PQHENEHPGKGQHAGNDLDKGAVESGTDVIDIVGYPAHQITVTPLHIEIHRQFVKMAEQITAQSVHRFLGDTDHPVVLQQGRHRQEQISSTQQKNELDNPVSLLIDQIIDGQAKYIRTEQSHGRVDDHHKQNKKQHP